MSLPSEPIMEGEGDKEAAWVVERVMPQSLREPEEKLTPPLPG